MKKLFDSTKFDLAKKESFWLLIIISLGLFVRLYKIGNPIADWHSWRQADTSAVARIFMDEGVNMLAPTYYDISRIQTGAINLRGLRLVEFPINGLIHAVVAKNISFCPSVSKPGWGLGKYIYLYFFPENVDIEKLGVPCFEIWGRVVSVVFSLISVYLMYLLGKNLYGKKVGLISAFLFSFIPYNIYFSRVILPEPMAVTFALGGLYFFVRFVSSENKWLLYSSAILFALSFLLKPFTIIYLLPLLYLTFKKYGKLVFKDPPLIIRLLLFVNFALAPFFIWRIWINKYPPGIPHFEWAFNGDHIRFSPAFWYWIFGERLGKLILGVWGIVPLYLGLVKRSKNLFAHYFLGGALIYLFVVATANVRHDYYQIIIFPALVLMIAVGLEAARSKVEKITLLICVVLAIVIGAFQVKEFYKINHPEIIIAGAAVQKIVPQDAFVIAPYNGDSAFLYQTRRFGWPVVDEGFDAMKRWGARYFVAVNFNDPDVSFVEKTFKVIEKTDQYIIADLLQKP